MASSSNKYKKYADIQHFLDIEAHVDSEDDTQDDPSAGPDALLDDFLVESSDSDSDEPNSTSTSKLGAQYYQREREELQASVDALRTRHRTSESLAHADSERWMSFLKYPPSIQDPELWRARVRPRWEFSVVATILNKSQALKIPVSSAFYRDSIPGAVYIEGSYHDCVTVLDGINGVWLNHYNTSAIEHVHFSDRIALLDQTTSNPAPPKHTFVRLRCRGPYRHMLAFIKEVSTSSEVEVLVVPRSRSEGSFLPLALAMTEPSQTEPYIPPSPIHDTHHVFGLRIRHIPVRSLQLSPSHPTSTELTLLESSPLFDLNTLDIPSTVDPSNGDLSCLSKAFTRALLKLKQHGSPLETHEQVEVVGGAFKGLCGKILEIAGHLVLISPNAEHVEAFEVPLHHLRSCDDVPVAMGISVEVRNGPYRGMGGRVTSMFDDTAIIDPSFRDVHSIEVPISELVRYIRIGDYVKVNGLELSGFVVEATPSLIEVYVPERAEDTCLITSTPLAVKRTVPPIAYAHTHTQAISVEKEGSDPFKGLEVYVIGTRTHLKGHYGYIVGHTLEDRSPDGTVEEHLVFEVNSGIEMTSYTTRVEAKFLQEKYSRLPLLKAVRLPRWLLAPPVPLRQATPPPNEPNAWPEVGSTTPTPSQLPRETVHWLLRRGRPSGNFCFVVRGTTEHRHWSGLMVPAYRSGRYENKHGFTSLDGKDQDLDTSIRVTLLPDMTSVKLCIKYLDPLQDASLFIVGAHVVVIGPDVQRNESLRGYYGLLVASPYPLLETQRLVALQQGWAYFDISSLCYVGRSDYNRPL